jgi:hypothetical protein
LVRILNAEREKLKRAIRRSLRAQGFHLEADRITFRQRKDKRSIRKRHRLAVQKRIALAAQSLAAIEAQLIEFIASGHEVNPQKIQPRLEKVEPGTLNSKLFRYACLHWSIPISDGYGRRLRFLIFDRSNNKLIGLLGLSDPVYAIRTRDDWIGWNADAKAERLYHVMDAYVLGAVPPYSNLLGGKLIALIAGCDEVRAAFKKRYKNSVSLISRRRRKPHLVLLTTTSALGRSSIYNRVKFRDRTVFRSVGFTDGWGEFHFSDGVYDKLTAFAQKHCEPTAKQTKWGKGFRNRRELVRKALKALSFPQDMLHHGIQREVFVAPLTWNSRGFLRGSAKSPRYHQMPFSSVVRFWRKRWLLPRVERDASYKCFDKRNWLLWSELK